MSRAALPVPCEGWPGAGAPRLVQAMSGGADCQEESFRASPERMNAVFHPSLVKDDAAPVQRTQKPECGRPAPGSRCRYRRLPRFTPAASRRCLENTYGNASPYVARATVKAEGQTVCSDKT